MAPEVVLVSGGFDLDLAGFTTRDLAREAAREVVVREKVYLRLIERGRLPHKRAALQLALMRAIAAKLEALAEAEEAGR